RLAITSEAKKFIPVALPPGRAKLATRPNLTGSSETPKTIGIVVVAAFASGAATVKAGVAITATRRRTRSAMSDGKRVVLAHHVLALDVAGLAEGLTERSAKAPGFLRR